MIYRRAGDTEPSVRVVLERYENGVASATDLENATVEVRWWKPSGEYEERGCTIEDAQRGVVSFPLLLGDTIPGQHRLVWRVTNTGNGNVSSYPQRGYEFMSVFSGD
jgi:hypothetical protein